MALGSIAINKFYGKVKMVKKILVDGSYPQETRVVLLKDGNIQAIEYETQNNNQIKGNIYLAKILRVEPSLQAAFIDYGDEKNGFLPFSEIQPSYYNIPTSDRDVLSADLHSINRPDISSEDIEEEVDVPDEKLFSLDGEVDDEQEDDEEEKDDEESSQSREELYKKYKIQDVIKKGQIILVQATKETRGNKGASFTSYISLAGRYCVLIPNSEGRNGISRKIANLNERKRLKSIINEMIPKDSNISMIVRTAGVKRNRYELKRDYDYLVRLWNKIREVTLDSKAPAFIHVEDDLIHKTIRDMYENGVSEILVEGNYAFNCAREIMHNMVPNDVDKVVEYKAKSPIFTKFQVEDQLMQLYQPVSELKSGGYVVINPTEALISIDVNSGRSTGERNIEETAYRTNLEAAKEIARQLKLRDLSGLIVVDFIDMYESKHRKAVERAFKEALSLDKARIQVGNISSFGLLEMSRQRLKGSFLEVNSKTCDHCSGKGIVRADESNAMLMLRTVEREISEKKVDVVNLYSHVSAIQYLLNNKRAHIKLLEEKHNFKLNIITDTMANADNFSIETIVSKRAGSGENSKNKLPVLKSSVSLMSSDEVEINSKPKSSKRRRKNAGKPDRAEAIEHSQKTEAEAESTKPKRGRRPKNSDEESVPKEKAPEPKKRGRKKKTSESEASTPTKVEDSNPKEEESKPKRKTVARKNPADKKTK